MPGVALLQADDRHAETTSAGGMGIDSLDSRNTELV
jgi:hypothetical protein